MSTRMPLPRPLLVGVILLAGCAGARRPPAESPQRVPDSAPDKIAAQRAAAGLHLEEEDQRWGFDAARELKQQQKEQKEQRKAPPSSALPPAQP